MSKRTGRPTGVRLTKRQADATREKIRVSHILRRLHQHYDGEIDLTPTQVRTAELLLSKSLPTLAQQTVEQTIEDRRDDPESMPDSQLLSLIEGGKGK